MHKDLKKLGEAEVTANAVLKYGPGLFQEKQQLKQMVTYGSKLTRSTLLSIG